MKEIIEDTNLVAYCGLFCGACKKYLKDKCLGCIKNDKASWCKVRTCCIENNFANCAVCTEIDDIANCKKYNNLISRLFGLILRSDRQACIRLIKEKGLEQYVKEMAQNQIMAIKR